jgi:glycosyltransferase involved in cell wall biosynthesis
MRLLLVTDSYPPFIGGADRQIQMIAQAMRDGGHEVAVATPWQPGLARLEDDGGVIVHRLRSLTTRIPWFSKDPRRRSHPPFPDPMTTIGIRRIVKTLRPDIVHSYGWISYSAAAAVSGTDIPLLLSTRDYGNVCAVRNFLYYRGNICDGPAPLKCLRCAAFTYTQDDAGNSIMGRVDAPVRLVHRLRGGGKAAAAVLGILLSRPLLRAHLRGLHTNSQFVRFVMDRYLLEVGEKQPRPLPLEAVIPSFLPPGETDVADEQLLQRLPHEPYILFVGALNPQKGIWPLLGAYRRLRQPAPPLVLLGPSFYNSPKEFPPGVFVLGGTSHATVMAAWDRAMFGVVPSVGAETFGNVVTEAMVHGRPVVASSLGGIVDIIEDGVTGLLVPAGDEQALASAMQRLLDDESLRSRLGNAARVRVERYAAARVLPQFEEFYEQILSRRDRETVIKEPRGSGDTS